eukprot:126915_1
MENLVKLMNGIELLTNNEFIDFIQLFGKDYFATLLFNHFYDNFTHSESQSVFNDTITEIKTFNDHIMHVISLRTTNPIETEHNKQQESELQPIQMDELPSVMISKISSFIQFEDLKSFELCNRSIFIGTRSPISLYQISTVYTEKLIKYMRNNESTNASQYFHLYRFKSLKYFTLEIDNHF